MGKLALHFLIATFLIVSWAMNAADSWSAVKDLGSGTELRIYKTGAKQPLLEKLDEAGDDKITVVLKNEQVAIAKSDIDRLDFRPKQTGKLIMKETKNTSGFETGSSTPMSPHTKPGPTASTSTSLNIGSKPDFETVYRRSGPSSK